MESAYALDVAVDRTLRFSRDARHWAALAGSLAERRLFLVVDGRRRMSFDAEEFFGSPGGDPAARLGAWVRRSSRSIYRTPETRGS